MKPLWMLAYAVLCLAEFLVSWGKDYVGDRVKGKSDDAG
jgi:hypothetical protein